jgi:hypothetical protein
MLARQLHVLPGVDVQRLLRRRERVEQREPALEWDLLVVPLEVELDGYGDPPRGLDQRGRPERAEDCGLDQRLLRDERHADRGAEGEAPVPDGHLADLGPGRQPGGGALRSVVTRDRWPRFPVGTLS